MPQLDEALLSARAMVRGILTQQNVPDEDAILFSVIYVDAHDPEWLLEQLADRTYPMAGRIEVLYNCGSVFDQGLEILRQEDPTLGPIRPL